MEVARLNSLVDEGWDEAVRLMQDLISVYPHYDNHDGLQRAASLIQAYLARGEVEHQLQEYTNAEINSHPLYVDVKEFGSTFNKDGVRLKQNVLSFVDGAAPGRTLILNGHFDVDCVSTPERWSRPNGWRLADISNGRLHGRGASDMLGGLCAEMLITRILRQVRDNWRGRLITAAVCDEEVGGNSTLRTLIWLSENGYVDEITEALIAEPSDRMASDESLGFFHVKAAASRQSLHMGVAQRSNSALYDIVQLVDAYPHLINMACKDVGQTSAHLKVRHNWGVISGGQDPAIPFGNIQLEGCIFLPEEVDHRAFQAALLKRIQEATGGVATAEFSAFHFPGAKSATGRLLPTLLALPKRDGGIPPVSGGLFPSPCDARLFKHFSIPVTIYGPGSLKQAHSIDEWVDLEEVKAYSKQCLGGIWSFLHD